jgi:hypothetical protein
MDSTLEPVVSRLSGEFDHVLPPSLVAACVEQAAPAGDAPAGVTVAEQVAREDLTALADAATRGSMLRSG